MSKHPLSQSGEQKNDERLTGVWYQETEDGVVYIHVASTKDGKMEGVSVDPNGNRGMKMMFCEGFTSQLGQQRFLNISQCARIWPAVEENEVKKESDLKDFYLIIRYEISDAGEFTYVGISGKYVEESIKAGRLEGSFEGFAVRITASTPDLVKFIEESDPDKLFYKPKEKDMDQYTFRKMVIPSN